MKLSQNLSYRKRQWDSDKYKYMLDEIADSSLLRACASTVNSKNKRWNKQVKGPAYKQPKDGPKGYSMKILFK